MIRRLRGWWALPGSERSTFLLMLILLPAISLLLRAAGYVRTRRWIERASPVAVPRIPNATEMKDAETLAKLAAIAGRFGAVPATCLRQSLLVYGWLRRRGLAPELILGVRVEAGQLDAHAWVELQHVALANDIVIHTPLPEKSLLEPTAR